MILALVKNGVVVNRVAVPDGVTVVPLQNPSDAKTFDLYDGRTFTANPEAANLKELENKKRAAIAQLSAAEPADFAATLATVSAANPVDVPINP